MVQHAIGIVNVFLGTFLCILLLLAIVKASHVNRFDIQIILLISSTLLLLPSILFENYLFLNYNLNLPFFELSRLLVLVIFIPGIIGYFIYHIYLLTIEDFPLIPLSMVLVVGGFTIGMVLISFQIDFSNSTTPISYDPLLGGVLFFVILILYSLIGVVGFFHSLLFKPFPHVVSKITGFDFMGLVGVALTPTIMFILRVPSLNVSLPFNIIFLTTTIGFIFHYTQYLINQDKAGYPLHSNLINLMILDIDQQTVLSGYTTNENPETKLHGMAMLAVDNLMRQILGDASTRDLPNYLGNYGDILFIKEDKLILIASFTGLGKKIGQFVLSRLLKEYNNRLSNNREINFKELVEYYIYPYTHKKAELKPVEFYTIGDDGELPK